QTRNAETYCDTDDKLITDPLCVSLSELSSSALSKLAPLEAILFDIDGTLCDSDPIHFCAFRELLQQVGFNNGVPISEEFYSANISGGHNDDLARALFPDLDHDKAMKFMDDKEALYRRYINSYLLPYYSMIW
ncbi:Os10g0568900, partial [Oryza sativa Japonica Group]